MKNKKNKKKNHQKNVASVAPSTPSLPYQVKISESLGRYIVASRDIPYGEKIITEEALTIGPTLGVNNTCCIGCFAQLNGKAFDRCMSCSFPICKEICTGVRKYHSKDECNFFKEKQLSGKLPSSELFDLIFPLRVLFLKSSNSEKFATVLKCEAHIEQRRMNRELWETYQKRFVAEILALTEEFSEEEIQFVLGVIDVNCFELGNEFKKSRALFPSAFLMAHECVCNTRHSDDPETNTLTVMACRNIKKGEMITINYGYTLQGTMMRRKYIFDGKYFWCSCKRCSDPTELQTYASALVCSSCSDGKVLPLEPLNQDGVWKCNLCSLTIEGSVVNKLLNKLYDELEDIGPHSILGQENFLNKYKNVLGPNHYLLLSAKYSLCQLLGKMEGYVINELSDEYLKKKESYCRQLLAIDAILEPGKSRLRGMLLYELHAPIMISSTKQIQEKQISVNKFKQNINDVIKMLTESFNILKLEPESTTEYEVAMAAKQALDSMT